MGITCVANDSATVVGHRWRRAGQMQLRKGLVWVRPRGLFFQLPECEKIPFPSINTEILCYGWRLFSEQSLCPANVRTGDPHTASALLGVAVHVVSAAEMRES